MRELAQEILREVLSEQMESEAEDTPATEEIRMRHTFSEPFLRKMRSLVKMQESGQINAEEERGGNAQGKQRQEKQVKEELHREESLKREQEQEEQENRAEKKILRGFLTINANRAVRRIAAACLACIILLSAGILGYQGLLRAGRVGAGSSSSYTTAATDGIGEAEKYDTGTDAAENETVEESVSDAGGEIVGEDAGNEKNGESAGNEADEKGESNEPDDEESIGDENARDEVSLTIANVTDHSAILEISNETGGNVSYSDAYELECYDEKAGAWTVVPVENEIVYDEIAYIVPDGETVTCMVDWSDAYGSLSDGTYRIIKEVRCGEEETSYALTAEFVID